MEPPLVRDKEIRESKLKWKTTSAIHIKGYLLNQETLCSPTGVHNREVPLYFPYSKLDTFNHKFSWVLSTDTFHDEDRFEITEANDCSLISFFDTNFIIARGNVFGTNRHT